MSDTQFPFKTTTKDGRKATVLGAMPDGRLVGFIKYMDGFACCTWDADGSHCAATVSITLPLQIKPLTTYRMRDGRIAWTSGMTKGHWICGMTEAGVGVEWRVKDGRWRDASEDALDLIEELPPGTTR